MRVKQHLPYSKCFLRKVELNICKYEAKCPYLQVQISIVAIWINEKVMTVIPETCICPAYLPNLMTPANRKQLLAAVFICAAILLVQKSWAHFY